ncbi:hypothetical protein DFH08DRAFT_847679 [Mycena albidolilacea]|uniref:F-box domain-containing protein n=1 Tax=Mycena albidolilacea TaxID=1033008 RepID=A0AAD7EYA6_9AGAR|nr:hypothetical protein DFH08DRAFT_847679 [Mycena albidolilacea]
MITFPSSRRYPEPFPERWLFTNKTSMPELALEVCWEIFNKVSPLDRIRLSGVSRSWRAAFEPYHLHLLSKFLLRFFPALPAAEFRALQKETGMVISGSAAIQVLENEFWDGSDLDLYVEDNHDDDKNVTRVAEFILSHGCIFQPMKTRSDVRAEPNLHSKRPAAQGFDFAGGISAVFTFIQGASKVQVISTRCPVLSLILMFHSICEGNPTDQATARDKYDQRGWTSVPELDPKDLLPSIYGRSYGGIAKQAFALGARWLGDRLTLSIQLDGFSTARSRL